MFRKQGNYRTELRSQMRGGDGEVKIEHFWEPGKEMLSHTRMCARLTLAPGCSIGCHDHKQEEEIFVIVKGTAEADDNGTKVILNPGDTLLTGNGNSHGIRNIGNTDLELVAVIGTY